MFFRINIFFSKIKNFLFLPLIILPVIHISASEIQNTLSDNARISILSVNYTDLFHSLFSKSCIRIYDKENGINQLVDFAYFENFDDKFFLLNFLINEKKAEIKIFPYINYFIEQSAKSNVSLTEFILTLNKDEINYIYSFINTLHTALPDYKYEFEFLTNNSETHISKILHDSIRMKGKNPDEEFLLSQIWKHNLQPKKINNSYVYLSQKENLNIDNTEPVNYLHEEYFTTIIILLIWLGVTFLTTVYQTIVCFFDKIYISSFYKSIQVFDLLLFVLAGITGCVIFFLDIFSTQSLLKNNYQYFIFMPLHLIFAFSIFKPFKDKRLLITYWSLVSFSSLIFILIYSLINHKFPVITALLAGILVIRTLYFAFLAFISLKKIPRSIKNEG